MWKTHNFNALIMELHFYALTHRYIDDMNGLVQDCSISNGDTAVLY